MKALALDPGGLCGWAVGELGGTPRWGTHATARGASTGEALSGFAAWLRDLCAAEEPSILVFESPYIPFHGAQIPRNAATVRRLHCYAGMIEAVAWRMRIEVCEARPSEICQAFTGQGSWGGRAKKKAATVRQCLAFGWDVAGAVDAADALALWAYAEVTLDPIAASQRRARLGLELELHPPPNEDAPRSLVAGRRGTSKHATAGKARSHDKHKNATPAGELQLPRG